MNSSFYYVPTLSGAMFRGKFRDSASPLSDIWVYSQFLTTALSRFHDYGL